MRFKRKTAKQKKTMVYFFHAEKMGCAQEKTKDKKEYKHKK